MQEQYLSTVYCWYSRVYSTVKTILTMCSANIRVSINAEDDIKRQYTHRFQKLKTNATVMIIKIKKKILTPIVSRWRSRPKIKGEAKVEHSSTEEVAVFQHESPMMIFYLCAILSVNQVSRKLIRD